MLDKGFVDGAEVKKANIAHHDVEAEVFELRHPEGSSVYEKANASESIALIVKGSKSRKLCIDVGCGTGFLTEFELPFYDFVVAVDISRKMVKVAKKRLRGWSSLDLIVCDADFLPFKRRG